MRRSNVETRTPSPGTRYGLFVPEATCNRLAPSVAASPLPVRARVVRRGRVAPTQSPHCLSHERVSHAPHVTSSHCSPFSFGSSCWFHTLARYPTGRTTGAASDHNVGCSTVFPPIHFRHVPQVGHVRVMVRQDGFGEWVDFRVGQRLPSERFPCDRGRFDAAEKRNVLQFRFLSLPGCVVCRFPSVVAWGRVVKPQTVKGSPRATTPGI